jgi:hypothetical protein
MDDQDRVAPSDMKENMRLLGYTTEPPVPYGPEQSLTCVHGTVVWLGHECGDCEAIGVYVWDGSKDVGRPCDDPNCTASVHDLEDVLPPLTPEQQEWLDRPHPEWAESLDPDRHWELGSSSWHIREAQRITRDFVYAQTDAPKMYSITPLPIELAKMHLMAAQVKVVIENTPPF